MGLILNIGRQGAYFFLILFGVSFLTFVLSQLVPGDPAEILLRGSQEAPSQEQIMSMRRDLGLDKSLVERYALWLGRVLKGDLGDSWRTGQPVLREITDHLPATLELTFFTFILVVLVSSAAGFLSALKQDKPLDRLSGIWAVVFLSLPNFWLGTLLIYFLALKLNWFPVLGRGGFSHLVLPVLTLALPVAALQSRVLRTRVLELLSRDDIRFARAKGLKTKTIVKNHLIRNALPSVIALWGLTLGNLLGGSFIVESIFSWPGLGRLTVEAVLNRDQPLIQGTILFLTLCFAVINLGVDWVQKVLDPRLKAESFQFREGTEERGF
jgi:ABC-type dipeptide/oligopeptide/nickel transport system permease component